MKDYKVLTTLLKTKSLIELYNAHVRLVQTRLFVYNNVLEDQKLEILNELCFRAVDGNPT
jgi:hypothetical protein